MTHHAIYVMRQPSYIFALSRQPSQELASLYSCPKNTRKMCTAGGTNCSALHTQPAMHNAHCAADCYDYRFAPTPTKHEACIMPH